MRGWPGVGKAGWTFDHGAALLTPLTDAQNDHARAMEILIAAAHEAGDAAMRFFRAGEVTTARVDSKHGGSPVSEADYAADELLAERLSAAFPDAGLLSEERGDDLSRLHRTRLLIVDPIDGTRAFVSGDARWCVSVALVEAGRPVAAVVHAPALGETFAAARGCSARRNGAAIEASRRSRIAGARIAGPKFLAEAIASEAGSSFVYEPKIPSLAWRLCLVAAGDVDLGLASDKAHDWDIAAADLILQEAGGMLCGLDGAPLRYNRAETFHGILLAAPVALAGALVAAANSAVAGRRPNL